ncbi:MAG: hypothetical protein EPO42_01150 [Gallionellaceae bacterium]|nr:MAG: hypothetical protein EPO42_01150 [Gallionellaceae bacterium]
MNEFSNRIESQRHVLQLVNQSKWGKEELFGLSSKAIERWISVNLIDPESRLVRLVKESAAKLFFLANKSQEQITDEYIAMSNEVASIAKAIEMELAKS